MMGLFEWWRKRRAMKEYIDDANCEAIHLDILETKLKLKYERLQLRILRHEEKRLKRKPDYVC